MQYMGPDWAEEVRCAVAAKEWDDSRCDAVDRRKSALVREEEHMVSENRDITVLRRSKIERGQSGARQLISVSALGIGSAFKLLCGVEASSQVSALAAAADDQREALQTWLGKGPLLRSVKSGWPIKDLRLGLPQRCTYSIRCKPHRVLLPLLPNERALNTSYNNNKRGRTKVSLPLNVT